MKSRLFGYFVMTTMLLLGIGCSSSGSEDNASMAGDWAIFVSAQDSVSTSTNASYTGVCSCNRNMSTNAPDVALRLWTVAQDGANLTITDKIDGSPVGTGTVSGSLFTATAGDGSWRSTGQLSASGCCFEGVGSASDHWHGIKWASSGAGCKTEQDRWESERVAELEAGSLLVETAAGEIEYAIYGDEGPAILFFHGGQGGYDQINAFMPGIIGQGFRCITWSRPGYLRTALTVGESPAQQADNAAALLDALGIDQVAAMGGSAGGPPLYEFALRHPDRLWALVPVSAVSQTYAPRTDDPDVLRISYLFVTDGGMWIYNAMLEYAELGTARQLLSSCSTLDAQAFDAWLSHVFADEARVSLIHTLFLSFAPSTPRAAGTANDLTYDAQLGQMPVGYVRTPSLVVHGTNDGDVDPKDAVYSSETIPGAEMYWVQNGTHFLMLADEAGPMIDRITSFLWQYAPR